MEDLLQQEAADPSTSLERLKALAKEHPSLHLTIASNPSAPPDWLASLRQNPNAAIRRNVVKNPNSPMLTLILMGSEFPQDLLSNPTFLLSFLENPDYLRQVHNQLLIALAPYPEIPLPLMHRAVYEYEYARREAAKNPALPEEFAFFLAGDEKFEVRRDVFAGRCLPDEKRNLLRRLGVDAARAAPLPSDKNITAEELSICCESGGFAQYLVAVHPNVTGELLERLSKSSFVMALSGVARNERTPATILHRLFERRSNEQISIALLQNPKLPLELVRKFAARANAPLAHKIALAARPELSPEQLTEFSKSARIAVRVAVAKNPSAPASVLSAFCLDNAIAVRVALVAHPNLSEEDIAILSRDKSTSVRYQLSKRPILTATVLDSLRRTRSLRELESLAKRRDVSPDIASSLLLMPSERVFLAALHNPNTPKEFADLVMRVREKRPLSVQECDFLYAHSNDARALLAEHPQSTLAQLQEMARTEDPLLCTAVARSPNATSELLRSLLNHKLGSECLMTAARRLANLGEEVDLQNENIKKLPEWLQGRLLRKFQRRQEKELARAEDTSLEKLEWLAKQNEKDLMLIIATRPNLPLEALDWFKGRFIRKLLSNPEFVGRLQERPALFYRLPLHVLQSVLPHPNLPEIFLQWACEHSSIEVRLAVSKNPKLSALHLQQLVKNPREYTLLRSVAQHPNATKELLAGLVPSFDPWLNIWVERRLRS